MGVCEEDAHMSATGLASQIDIWTFVFTRRLQKRPLAPLPLQGPTRGGRGWTAEEGGGMPMMPCSPRKETVQGDPSQEDSTVLGRAGLPEGAASPSGAKAA